MSQWTHVNAVIRIDDIRVMGLAQNQPDIFASPLPEGSEGGLNHLIWVNPHNSSVAAYTATIFGDLRDYNDADEIIAHLNAITKGRIVRSGIAEIDIEYRERIIAQSDERGEWKIIVRIPRRETAS